MPYCRQRRESISAAESSVAPYLDLVCGGYGYATLEGEGCVECVSLLPPTTPPLEQLLQMEVCHSFSVS